MNRSFEETKEIEKEFKINEKTTNIIREETKTTKQKRRRKAKKAKVSEDQVQIQYSY